MLTDAFDLATSAKVPGIIEDHQADENRAEAQSTRDPLSQTTLCKSEYSSPKRAAQEVCHIMSRNFRLFLGTLSVSTTKKVTRLSIPTGKSEMSDTIMR
jgi:hypothetical protein